MLNRDEICDFGPHNGMLYRKLPISYLHWMINSKYEKSKWAIIELNKRTQAVKASKELV